MKTLCLLFVLSFCNLSHAQLNGPNAPDVYITYITSPSLGFSFNLNNSTSSNNYFESYLEFDSNIDVTAPDQLWRFQGYLIFQLVNDTIDLNETFDPNYSQLATVLDISDTITNVNLILDGCVSSPLVLNNSGTQSNFMVSQDAFTNAPFIDNEEYCFRVVAFASNPFSLDAICGISNYVVCSNLTGTGISIPSICVLASELAGLPEQDFGFIDVYPNPTMGSIFIESQSKASPPYMVTIFNELGQVVLSRTITERNVELELPYSGVFMLRIEKDGTYTDRKIIRF